MRRAPAPAVLAAALLSGCVVGPHYHAPSTPRTASGEFIEAAGTSAVTPSVAPADPRWWRLYDDAVLDRLIAEAFAANTDLRQAYANVARARGALREARAARFPAPTISAQYTYNQFSTASPLAGSFGGSAFSGGSGASGGSNAPSIGRQYSLFDLGPTVSYELDLFGRVTRQIQAARRDLEAERALADQMRVTVAADTARAYADLCANAVQEEVAVRTLAILTQSLRITQATLDYGTGTRLDVERERALYEQTAATIPQFRAAKAAARYSLAYLTGRAPADLNPAAIGCTRTPALAQPIPIGDGAALIARRPDVRAAERTLAADTARIGVETAGLYPSVSLGGTLSLQSGSVRRLFTSSALSYSAGPLISFTFPNQEVARGRILQARGQAAVSLAAFDGAVLAALRDTETAIAELGRELDRYAALARARDAAARSAQLSTLRSREGLDPFLTQLDAQRTLVQAEAALAQSEQLVAEDQVELFRALGGGWEGAKDPRGDGAPVFDGSRPQPRQR